MNLRKHFFALLLIIFLTAQGFAKEKNNTIINSLSPTPLSVAKSQLMLGLESNSQYSFRHFFQESDQNTDGEYKVRGKAFIRSLVLPGAGERYLGKKTLANTFLIAEISLWVGYFAFKSYGKWVREDALAFAATHSGAITDGKPSQFFVDIGNYKDIEEYNDAKQRMWQFDKVYDAEDYYWQWDEDSNRSKFESMRIASDQAVNRSVFVLGGIFANHLLSAIDAVWQTSRHNKKLNKKSVSLKIKTDFKTGEIALNIQKLF